MQIAFSSRVQSLKALWALYPKPSAISLESIAFEGGVGWMYNFRSSVYLPPEEEADERDPEISLCSQFNESEDSID